MGLLVPPMLVILALDRLTKQWAAQSLAPVGSVEVVSGILGWRYAENRGAAFSAFAGAGVLLCALTGLIIAAALVWLIRRPHCGWWTKTGLVMLIAGGLGNLYDRVRFGYVIDFIEALFVRFAIFNVADVFVVTGTACLVIGILKAEDRSRHAVSGRG